MIFFLIPVYNEEDNLKRLIHDTSQYMTDSGYNDFRFIFVNDGSSDLSLQILEEFQSSNSSTIVLSHFPNAGVRKTFLTGFKAFLKFAKKGDILITKEADNTSDNSILSVMIERILQDKADVVLASCYMPGGGLEKTNIVRKFMSFSANLLIKIRFNLWNLHTFSSFYRAFSYSCLRRAFESSDSIMSHDGFTCVVEMLIKLKILNFKIVEVPMTLRSSERVGQSKMPILKTIKGYLYLSLVGVNNK
jgi:dolichol-phosphate mannosyltransferase